MIDRKRFNRWFGLGLTFMIGHGAWQILRLITGFLLINWLTKDDYATYTLVLAIKGTAAVLLDLGISGGLIALIGKRCHQPEAVGRYIAVAKFFRDRLIAIGVFALLLTFFLTGNRFDWGLGFALQIWALVVLAIYFESRDSFFNPILSLQQRLKEKYALRFLGLFLRFLILVALYLSGWINVTTVLIAAVIEAFFVAVVIVRMTRADLVYPPKEDPLKAEKKEALDLTLPKVPGVVFYALQGQVTIFIVGVMGAYEEIASLGALNKMGLLFMVPAAFTSGLVVPYYAKLRESLLLKGYILAISSYSCFGMALIVGNYLFPELFLFLLGENYADLEHEIFLFSIFSVLNLLTNLSYGLTSSRKWVYYWSGPTTIASYLSILVGFLIFVDMSILSNVISMSICAAAVTLSINQIVFVIGYRRDKKLATSEDRLA